MREKQIEEMARFMCNCYDEGYCRMDGKLCDLECGSYKESEIFYEAGYRKQSEGEWEKRDFIVFDFVKTAYRCTSCNTTWDAPTKFCPNCGAKMKGGE